MTSAVFGDFLGPARQHLEVAVAAEARQVADLPVTLPSLRRLVTIMSLYLDDLAPCDEILAIGRADLNVWERAVIDAAAALRIATDCLRRSGAYVGQGEPLSESAPACARHLADAAAELAAGRDLLHTHIMLGPDGLAQERSDWAPVVTSLPVTRALVNEIAAWSVRLAHFTALLAELATPLFSWRLSVQPPREELVSASKCLQAVSVALRPALDNDPVRTLDAELLYAIPVAFPPPRQPLGSTAESIAELCDGIIVSASRLRAAVHQGRDRATWSPEVTSGGWQWMAQAAAITSDLSEMALRSLALRAGQLAGLTSTGLRLQGAADAMIGMRTAWQQVDLRWNTIITERRLRPVPAMGEASDLLLRMGRLVWDNPQWTPARADRGPRRDPAALAPGTAALTVVVSAIHQAVDCLAHIVLTDAAAVQAAGWAGRLYVPTRSLPAGFDVPRAYASAPVSTVLELNDIYRGAAEASAQAARELDELAIVVAAPSKALGLARAAALVPSRRRDGQGPWPDKDQDHPRRIRASFGDSRASTGLAGPVERAIRYRRVSDPVVLLRAAAIDNAARALIGLAENSAVSHADDAVSLAAESFPHHPVAGQPVNPSPPKSRPANQDHNERPSRLTPGTAIR